MLRRPATKITLTAEDVNMYSTRLMQREAERQKQTMQESPDYNTDPMKVENAQTERTQGKSRAERIGLGDARG
ncbi:hypothetical protein LTR66_003684 [Elasticomyces elasticus]|nr:hypothetical protein LTR66_003684 [Elasticomyces elasticus]